QSFSRKSSCRLQVASTLSEQTRLKNHAEADMKSQAIMKDINPSAVWAGISAFIFMVFGALTLQLSVIGRMGLSEDLGSSWIFIPWLSAGLVSLPFILRYRQPLAIGWTIPGLLYMASLADRFSFQEMVAANIIAGIAMVGLGLGGIGSRIIHVIPLPILLGVVVRSLVF